MNPIRFAGKGTSSYLFVMDMENGVFSIGWSRNSMEILDSSVITKMEISNDYSLEIDANMMKYSMDVSRIEKLSKTKFADFDFNIESDLVDITYDGKRWEGYSFNAMPCGFGSLYNENNILVYKGFLLGEEKVCWGSDFYVDCGKVEYCGTFLNGIRHGYGCLYDKEGSLVYKGLWSLGKPGSYSYTVFDYSEDDSVISNTLTSLSIGNNCFNTFKEIRILDYIFLNHIEIGDNSFKNVSIFEICNCNMLQRLIIGYNSFNQTYDINPDECKENGTVSIVNCQSLCGITTGRFSFGDFGGVFTLESNEIVCILCRSSSVNSVDSWQRHIC